MAHYDHMDDQVNFKQSLVGAGFKIGIEHRHVLQILPGIAAGSLATSDIEHHPQGSAES